MTDAKKKPDQPESPLAKAMRTGTLGGAKPQEEPATTKVPDKIEPEKDHETTKKEVTTTEKIRKRITGYVAPDIYQWTKIRAATEDRELSEVLEDALRLYKAKVQP